MTNPWGLTRRQLETMHHLVRLGCDKAVARAMELQPATVRARMHRVFQQMGAPNRVRAVVEFDRWERESKPATTK